jgi:hypothetical protein
MPHNLNKKRGGPYPKAIDAEVVRQLAMIGCTTETIARHFHCSRDTIERRFRWELDEGRSDGEIKIRGKLFQRAMNNSQRSLEVCAVNLCGWSLNAPQTVVNVVQHGAPVDTRTPEQIKAHLCELQRAVLEECRRFDPKLPPPT